MRLEARVGNSVVNVLSATFEETLNYYACIEREPIFHWASSRLNLQRDIRQISEATMNRPSTKNQSLRFLAPFASVALVVSALSFLSTPRSSAAIGTVTATKPIKKQPAKKTASKTVKAFPKPIVKSSPTTTVVKKSVVLAPAPTNPTTTTAPIVAATLVPLAVAPSSIPGTTATTIALVAPTTTVSAVTTTSTAPSAAFDFDLQIPSPRVAVAMGSSATMLLLVLPKGIPRSVDLFFVDLPNGVTVLGTPNPTTGGSEVRISASLLMVPGEYPLRVMALAGPITKFVGYTLTVAPSGTSGTSVSGSGGTAGTTTTTTIPSGSGGFTFVVTSDGKKLKTGGVVTLTAAVTPAGNFAGAASLRVLDVPEGVSVGFQQNPTSTTTAIWLSSTVPLKAGTYPLVVEAKTSTQSSQVQIVLTIEV